MLGEDCRHTHLLYRQRIVHKALVVALLEPETTHLRLGERHIRHRTLTQGLHLAVDGVAEQSRTTLGERVIDIVVYLRNVDARSAQHRQRHIEVGRKVREGEVTRVGHHTHIQHLRLLRRHALGTPQSLNNLIDKVRGARRIGIGEHNVELLRWVEVVVDEDTTRCGV